MSKMKTLFYGSLYEGETIEKAEEQYRGCAKAAKKNYQTVVGSYFDVLWFDKIKGEEMVQKCIEFSKKYFPDAEIHEAGRSDPKGSDINH